MFFRNLKFGLRLLGRAPGATAIAMLALGLGVGANTAIFSIANGILLHPLPYQHLNRLLDISEIAPHDPPTSTNSVSPYNYLTWKQQARTLDAVTAYHYLDYNLSGQGAPTMVLGGAVPANFFAVLPSKPLLGRTFLPVEEQVGHEHVVVLSQALWQHQYASDPRIVGRSIQVNQQPYTVIGVLGESAVMPAGAELWTPLALSPTDRDTRDNHYLRVVGELAPGATLDQAAAELHAIVGRTDARYPATNADWGVHVQTLADRTIGNETASYVFLLMGAVGFLLLIACANVANLQFARTLGRNHELAIRTALGAGRGRIVGQLLTESLLLGLGGAVVGAAFAFVSIRMILAYMPAEVAVFIGGWQYVRLDPTALAYTLGIAIAAGVLAGIAPAWHAARPDLNATLKEGGRGTIGHARRRLRSALVVVQVALALVLLVGAALMVEGFNANLSGEKQFQAARTLTAQMRLPQLPVYDAASARLAFFQRALDRLAALPGVQGAAMVSYLPLGGNYSEDSFSIEGQPVQNASQRRYAVAQIITPNFFSLLHIPLLSGRAFSAADGAGAPAVVVISQGLAQRWFAGKSPIGQVIKDGDDDSTSAWMTIVGVVSDVKMDFYSKTTPPAFYLPAAQSSPHGAFFLLRGSGSGDVTALAPAARQAVMAVDATIPLSAVMSLAKSIHNATIGIAYVSVMLTVAGLLALILAAIGVYGVMAYLVGERIHEFGIRRALGASSGALIGLVLRRGLVMLAWGLAIGLPVALFLARGIQSLIVGISASDIPTYLGVSVVLAAMVALACYIPARAATRVDPLTALREP